MFAVLTLVFVVLFYGFKSIVVHTRRVTRRNPEDDQTWQHNVSVFLALVSLLGAFVSGVLWAASWAI